jgi:hypothetical protein
MKVYILIKSEDCCGISSIDTNIKVFKNVELAENYVENLDVEDGFKLVKHNVDGTGSFYEYRRVNGYMWYEYFIEEYEVVND